MLEDIIARTPLVFFVQSFWRDEAFTYLLASKPLLELLRLTAMDFNPPFYYIFLKIWMIFFGSSEIALRFPSFIFYWLTIFYTYKLLNLFLKNNNVLYLILFMMNPVLIYYAFEARMYTLLTFLVVLSYYFLLNKKYKAYCIAIIIGVYTHYFMFIAIGFQLISILFTIPRKEWKQIFTHLIRTGLLYVPWLILLVFSHPPFASHNWIKPPTLPTIINLPSLLLTGFETDLGYTYPNLWVFNVVCYAIFGGIIVLYLYKKKLKLTKQHVVILVLWGYILPLSVLLISFVKPMFLPRYILFSTVGFTILIVYIIHSFPRYIRIITVVILIFCLLNYNQIQIKKRDKAPLKRVITEISSLMNPNDKLYVTHEFNFHPAQYYLRNKNINNVYIYKKTYEELPSYIGKVLIPKTSVTSLLPIYPIKAFIMYDNLTYEVRSID